MDAYGDEDQGRRSEKTAEKDAQIEQAICIKSKSFSTKWRLGPVVAMTWRTMDVNFHHVDFAFNVQTCNNFRFAGDGSSYT